ncbi:MAG TPA: cohesin domain-containing protein [Candidatus Levybacteria bacterium]|nr:cohesin domain-containing protein [Candidatus Levybacteria bacterium]
MNILKNKYFILGNILLLLAVIPITLFVISRQTNLQSKAAPTTIFSFTPTTINTTVGETFTLDIQIDPGQNIVSIVEMTVSVDPEKIEIVSLNPNTSAFPVELKKSQPNLDGTITISLSTTNNVQEAIQEITKIGTLTMKAKAATTTGATIVKFDKPLSQALSLATSDGATENVLSDTGTAAVTIVNNGGTTTITPSPSTIISPTPTTATQSAKPICESLVLSGGQSGVAPYALTFGVTGQSPNANISKVKLDFGDGTNQEATSSGGIGTKTVNIQIPHTYTNPGVYSAISTLTDTNGNTSDTVICTKTITVSNSQAQVSPIATDPTPTLPVTGTIETTLAVIGGVIIAFGIGIFLFIL